ncbi:MAG: LysE family translocator [Burkholderiales bacterium]|nr:LysE family translocator [Burkholderiales bacterium]
MNLGLQDLALFSLTVLILNATPGVDLLFTLTRALQHGVRGGLAAAAGINAGCVVHAIAATFGLAALLATSAAAFTALKLMGAVYLAWLAFGMLRSALNTAPDATGPLATAPDSVGVDADARPGAGATGSTAPPVDLGVIFSQGLLTNVLNPKVAIFFLALLPQFITADAPDKTMAFLALGSWFVLQSSIFLVGFVMLVAPLRQWQPSPTLRRGMGVASALLFVGLAARLALAESH